MSNSLIHHVGRTASLAALTICIASSALAGPTITLESPGDGVAIWGPTDVEVCVSATYVIDPVERPPTMDVLDADYVATVLLIDKTHLTVLSVSFPLDLGEERCRTVYMEPAAFAIAAALHEDSASGPRVDSDRIDFVVMDPHM